MGQPRIFWSSLNLFVVFVYGLEKDVRYSIDSFCQHKVSSLLLLFIKDKISET